MPAVLGDVVIGIDLDYAGSGWNEWRKQYNNVQKEGEYFESGIRQ